MGPTGKAPVPETPGRRPIYKDLVLLQLAALVFLIDQFTKFLVRELLPYRESFPQEGFLRITHTHNTGSAFGLFQGQNTPLILVAVFGITVIALIYRSQVHPPDLLRFSLGLQLGGAAGNLLDRLLRGHVTDFLDVGPWPVFNLADSSIVVGLAVLAWLFLRPQGLGRRKAAATVGETGLSALPQEGPPGMPYAPDSGGGGRGCPEKPANSGCPE